MMAGHLVETENVQMNSWFFFSRATRIHRAVERDSSVEHSAGVKMFCVCVAGGHQPLTATEHVKCS